MFGKRAETGAPQPPGRIPPPRHRCSQPGARPRLQCRSDSRPARRSARPRASGRLAGTSGRRLPRRMRRRRQAGAAANPRRSDNYYDIKSTIFNALIDAIDLTQLSQLDRDGARDEIRDIVNEIITLKDVAMSIAEQEELLEDICNDVLGYGPLEPLLARDDIADIMVNGANTCFIEVGGKMQKTGVRFRDNSQLLNICQRIVSQVGRRVDEASPICDARLARRLARQRHRAAARHRRTDAHHPQVQEGPAQAPRSRAASSSITPEGATILEIIGRVRCNVLISGGTGSGKTTLLNCLTGYIDHDERVITCEDAAELQLQQPHVVRLETRPPNLEGEGEITMRDLVKNCLRMRPERIIVGEVRGPEAFDLLAGDEHRPRRLDGHAARQQPARSPVASRIDDHHGRLRAAVEDDQGDDRRLDRRHRPGRPPARRFAPHHPHHRGDRHGRRRRSSPRICSSTRSWARTPMARFSAATARPASRGRISGIAPATTARSAALPMRSSGPKCATRQE